MRFELSRPITQGEFLLCEHDLTKTTSPHPMQRGHRRRRLPVAVKWFPGVHPATDVEVVDDALYFRVTEPNPREPMLLDDRAHRVVAGIVVLDHPDYPLEAQRRAIGMHSVVPGDAPGEVRAFGLGLPLKYTNLPGGGGERQLEFAVPNWHRNHYWFTCLPVLTAAELHGRRAKVYAEYHQRVDVGVWKRKAFLLSPEEGFLLVAPPPRPGPKERLEDPLSSSHRLQAERLFSHWHQGPTPEDCQEGEGGGEEELSPTPPMAQGEAAPDGQAGPPAP